MRHGTTESVKTPLGNKKQKLTLGKHISQRVQRAYQRRYCSILFKGTDEVPTESD